MYLSHFALKEKPFSISPDPRFLFLSHRYKEALGHLLYGVQEGGGFVLLTGEVGTGKTTVCRSLLQQLPANTKLAFVLNPKLNSLELLATICDELKIRYPAATSSLKVLTDKLTAYLLKAYEKNLNVVVMIDEAQNLDSDVLEQIRLLTNLETNQKKLLQIILVGQPELQEKLAHRNLRQLAQRVTARYHLQPLNLKETDAYILHRTRIAGAKKSLFSKSAIDYLFQHAKGVPRLINTICERALIGAYTQQQNVVEKNMMKQSVEEILGDWKVESHTTSHANHTQKWFGDFWQSTSGAWRVALLMVAVLVGGYYLGQSSNKAQSELQETAEIIIQSSETNSTLNKVNQWIGDQSWDHNGIRSKQQLLKLWQLDYQPLKNGEACDYASQYGLKCQSLQSNWQQLRLYNRPVILKFSAGIHGEFWGTLIRLDGLNGLMNFGQSDQQISLQELSDLWTGEALLIWQSPEGFTDNIKLYDSGGTVLWLSEKLNLIMQKNNEPINYFDQNLFLQLKQYQTSRGIEADGIAGMETILQINSETLQGIPILKDAEKISSTNGLE
ncbi:MAG: AAA family ATPase [Gammaproteobacteria bacterium]|nr:AAA family ATPase [Gammaproteobacteria bacterium]